MKLNIPAQEIDLPIEQRFESLDRVIAVLLENDVNQVRRLVALENGVPVRVEDPVIPVPPPGALNTKDFPGDDLGARLKAWDDSLGDRAGSIIVHPGTIATRVEFRRNRTLYLMPGEFPIVNPSDDSRYWNAPLCLGDGSAVYGAGRLKSKFIEPKDFGYMILESAGAAGFVRGQVSTGVTSRIKAAHFSIEGANPGTRKGADGNWDSGTSKFSVINFGNAHDCDIWEVGLNDISCMGIIAGGVSLEGNHAKRWKVWKVFTSHVASQVLAVVNGKDILFEECELRATGKLRANGELFAGATVFDVEPNLGVKRPDGPDVLDQHQDIIQDIIFRNNLIDSTDSPLAHGNGVVVQNNVKTLNMGPVLIEGNRIIGGPLIQNFAGKIHTGIYIGGLVSNVQVKRNHVQRVGSSGIRFEDGRDLVGEDNECVSTGTGGTEAFDVHNVTHSRFARNKVWLDPKSDTGSARIIERGTSDFNTFEDCDPKPILVGKNSR